MNNEGAIRWIKKIVKHLFRVNNGKKNKQGKHSMPDYNKEICGLLNGTKLGIPRERLDWYGYSQVIDLYKHATVDQQEEITKAMAQIIQGSTDWGVVADTIHLAYHLNIRKEIESAVSQLDLAKVPDEWKHIIRHQREIYISYIKNKK